MEEAIAQVPESVARELALVGSPEDCVGESKTTGALA
jgi:hypothetical protein